MSPNIRNLKVLQLERDVCYKFYQHVVHTRHTVYRLCWGILFPSYSENNPLYFMLKPGLHFYTHTPSWLNINRNVWNHSVGLYNRPPLHLCVYTSCERPSIYGQLKNTNNHPPRVKNLLLLSANFCDAFVYAHAAFWLPVYYYSVSAEPMGMGPALKGAKPSPDLFPVCVTSLCIPLKHTDACLVCSLGGTHHTKQFIHEVYLFWLKYQRTSLDTIGSHASVRESIWRTRVSLSVMKHPPVMASHFQLGSVICQLKHSVCPQAFNQVYLSVQLTFSQTANSCNYVHFCPPELKYLKISKACKSIFL